jgi:hypothetical protein
MLVLELDYNRRMMTMTITMTMIVVVLVGDVAATIEGQTLSNVFRVKNYYGRTENIDYMTYTRIYTMEVVVLDEGGCINFTVKEYYNYNRNEW